MARVWPVLALLVLGTLPAGASPRPLPVTGPLRVDTAYPPSLPFLALPAEGPQSLEPRRLALGLSATYANGFHWDPQVLYPDLEVLIDAEVLRLSLSAAWAPARGLSVEADLWLVGEYGGFLDPVIQGVHSFFRLPNGDRELRPQDRYGFRIVHDGQVLVDLEEPFWALGDLVLSAKWTLRDGQAGGVGAALQAALSLPVGSLSCFTSSGRLGAALGALASWRLGPFTAYGGLRYLYLGQPSWGPVLGFRPHNLGFFASLEWARSVRVAWLLQADAMSLPYLHPHPWLGALSGTVSFGTRFRLGPRLLLETRLSEELFSFATMDIAAGCALRLAI
jgi:hypothetical protein